MKLCKISLLRDWKEQNILSYLTYLTYCHKLFYLTKEPETKSFHFRTSQKVKMVRISFSAVSSLLILSASTSIFSLASTNGNKEETADGNKEGTVVGEDVVANFVAEDVVARRPRPQY